MSVTVTKQLPKPWTVGGQSCTEIELREPTLEDILDAEKDANPAISPNGFSVQIACRTMVRAGSFTGPFVAGQFKSMGVRQWHVVREGMQEAEALGED